MCWLNSIYLPVAATLRVGTNTRELRPIYWPARNHLMSCSLARARPFVCWLRLIRSTRACRTIACCYCCCCCHYNVKSVSKWLRSGRNCAAGTKRFIACDSQVVEINFKQMGLIERPPFSGVVVVAALIYLRSRQERAQVSLRFVLRSLLGQDDQLIINNTELFGCCYSVGLWSSLKRFHPYSACSCADPIWPNEKAKMNQSNEATW